MNEHLLYNSLLIATLAAGLITFIALFFIVAPYGRHVRKGWGYQIGNKLAWVLMEAASPIIFGACWLTGQYRFTAVSLAFLVFWEVHYVHRAFIYPFTLRGVERRMPLSIVFMGLSFNLINAYLNGRWVFQFSGGYNTSWFIDPRFIVGVTLFVIGYIINREADLELRSLRPAGESGYKISNNRFYKWVSCPNYLGEITIWLGWAVMTWSWAGLAFAFWTVANLMPRARANHAWYQKTFPDYPPDRKALLPRIW
jgi:3-oxo-5-alpha-steroid 4-dehydrogenase 1